MERKTLWATVTVCVAVYVPFAIWGLTTWEGVDLAAWAWLAGIVPLMLAAGVVMLAKRPENPIGELALWAGVTIFLIPTLLEIPTIVVFAQSGLEPWMWLAMWLAMTASAVGFVFIMRLVVLLPSGGIRYRRESRFLTLSWAVVAIPTISLITNEFVFTHSEAFVGVENVPSPLFISSLETAGSLVNTLGEISYVLFFWAVGLQFMRYREGSSRERKQVRWVLFGGISALLLGVVPTVLEALGMIDPIAHGSLASLIVVPVFLMFMGSVVIAVLEPPWADVDIVIRRSFVYGALSFVILLLYVGVASAFGVAAGARMNLEVAIVLTVIVALLVQPARQRLQVVVDRWVFGVRPSKYEAVTEFGETVEQASDPAELLQQLVETIRRALSLSWVVAELDDGSAAVDGDPALGDSVLSVPIRAGVEDFGTIQCGPKEQGSVEDEERQLVRTLAGQVGLAVMNARLAGRIVTAAESERRRIERNIHDGAQQELVALVARLGMARTAATKGELRAQEIDELQNEARQILVDLRDLAQGIHPSVLSDGGILEAVEERCSHLPIDVTVETPPGLRARRYGDDIEGAAYFFVTEALTNVLKHAGAGRATVELSPLEDHLWLSVTDDGQGFDASHASLNGLAGLRDRIRALGGTVSISSSPGVGTTVSATLPTI